jgi:hypothetical protein
MQKYCIAALASVIDTAELSSNHAFDATQFYLVYLPCLSPLVVSRYKKKRKVMTSGLTLLIAIRLSLFRLGY